MRKLLGIWNHLHKMKAKVDCGALFQAVLDYMAERENRELRNTVRLAARRLSCQACRQLTAARMPCATNQPVCLHACHQA